MDHVENADALLKLLLDSFEKDDQFGLKASETFRQRLAGFASDGACFDRKTGFGKKLETHLNRNLNVIHCMAQAAFRNDSCLGICIISSNLSIQQIQFTIFITIRVRKEKHILKGSLQLKRVTILNIDEFSKLADQHLNLMQFIRSINLMICWQLTLKVFQLMIHMMR